MVRLRQTKSDLLPTEVNAGRGLLDKNLSSSDSDSIASESDGESLANDLSAVAQKRAGTSTKLLETPCKWVKKTYAKKNGCVSIRDDERDNTSHAPSFRKENC